MYRRSYNQNYQLCQLMVWLLIILSIATFSNKVLAGKTNPQYQSGVTEKRLITANSDSENWLTHGRTYSEQRFSPLKNINDKNVSNLGLTWFFDLPDNRGQEATPLIADGVLYTSSAWSKVYALNAVTGELIWSYDPKVPGKTAVHACCDVVNRGVALWNDSVFVGTLDGRLIALDAKTGALKWETLTVDRKWPYTITGAPRIAKGKVFIGNGGAEFGVRGYISAYDVETGELSWRFYTVPGDPSKPFESEVLKQAAKTWTGEWWKLGGGGTVWDSMAYDPELDLLYFGVGNGSPWNQAFRSPQGGDNWFLSSIVAVRPDTGEYVWHYQTTPGEEWDYTATQHMILADLLINGKKRKVIMQAPKNGFFYVIDRETGTFISAENIVPVNWASHIDKLSGRPVENPDARYRHSKVPQLITPGFLGAHNWHPMSYSSKTGLVYIPAQEFSFPYKAATSMDVKTLAVNLGIDISVASMPNDPEIKKNIMASVRGHLSAWDPVNQKEVWRVQYPGPWNGGLLSTDGNLVFQGTAAGKFTAYSADKGEKLWSFSTQTGVVAPPVTFSVKGEQYVSLVVGWGGVFPLITGEISHKSGKQRNISRILTFKLHGDKALPVERPELPLSQKPPESLADQSLISKGKAVYDRFCAGCHGDAAVSGGVLPDLRFSGYLANNGWQSIISDGLLEKKGMVGFASEISKVEVEAIRAYVIFRANESYSTPN